MFVSNMTWLEYQKEIPHRIVFLPVGSLEQHGPHLPLCVDVVVPTNFARMVSEELGNGAILPAITYGYKSHPTSGGGQVFPGTTSLNGTTLINLALDVLSETYRHGGRKFVIVNGHYENEAFVTEAIDLFLRNAPDAKVVLLSWWNQVSDEMVDYLFAGAGFPGWDTEHAAITETSLMLYFAPELVREDAIIDDQAKWKPTYSVFPPPDDIIPQSGVLYKAKYASKEKGEKLAKHVTEKCVSIVRAEFQDK
jgi:creatinine amidohydrolase